MAKRQPGINLPAVLQAFAWLDVYLDSLHIEAGVPDLYHAVYGHELPSIQIDISDSKPMLLFELCELLEKNGYQDLVYEFFSVLMDNQIEVTSWTLHDVPDRKPK